MSKSLLNKGPIVIIFQTYLWYNVIIFLNKDSCYRNNSLKQASGEEVAVSEGIAVMLKTTLLQKQCDNSNLECQFDQEEAFIIYEMDISFEDKESATAWAACLWNSLEKSSKVLTYVCIPSPRSMFHRGGVMWKLTKKFETKQYQTKVVLSVTLTCCLYVLYNQ